MTYGSGWLLEFLRINGVREPAARVLWTLGVRESGGNPDLICSAVVNKLTRDQVDPESSTQRYDVGVWQINSSHLLEVKRVFGQQANMLTLLDATNSLAYVRHVSKGFTDWSPWGLKSDGVTFDWSEYPADYVQQWGLKIEANHRRIWDSYPGLEEKKLSGVWLTDLADVLRKAGVPVKEMTYQRGPWAGKSWKQVGANGQGLTEFKQIMWHHDASPAGDSPGALDWCMYSEVSPAASIWVDRYGTWHLYCAGLAWHAGTGGGYDRQGNYAWGIPPNMANHYALGIETDHGMNEVWPDDQINSLRLGTAAIMSAYGLDPAKALTFHKVWTDGGIDGCDYFPTRYRKNDPDGLDIFQERKMVAALMDPRTAQAGRVRARLERARARRREAKAAGQPTDGLSARIKRLREKLRSLLT